MSRHVVDAPITTPTSRSKLQVRAKPYFRSLDPKLSLGYRKSKAGGQWLMRAYDGGGRYYQVTIGVADDHQPADGSTVVDYGQACKIARDRYTRRDRRRKALPEDPSGSFKVKHAVADYVQYLRDERKSADNIGWTLNAYISVNDLAEVECENLTMAILRKWRNDISKMPGRRRSYGGKQKYSPYDPKNPEHVRARRASANDTFAFLCAALNRACEENKITSDNAWRKIPPFPETDKARLRYLELAEVVRLLDAAQAAFYKFLCGGLHTGARPSELARVQVRDFHEASGTLHVVKSKTARDRHIVLTDDAVVLFRGFCSGREGTDLIFARENGKPWKRHNWCWEMPRVTLDARLSDVTYYTLRHTYCSHAVMNGMALTVLAKNLGHANTKMVEKHYAHLSKDFIAREIREHAPTFRVEGQQQPAPVPVG